MPMLRCHYEEVLSQLQRDYVLFKEEVAHAVLFSELSLYARLINNLICVSYLHLKSVMLSDYIMEIGNRFDKMYRKFCELLLSTNNKIHIYATPVELNALPKDFFLETEFIKTKSQVSFFPATEKEYYFHRMMMDKKTDKLSSRDPRIVQKLLDKMEIFQDDYAMYAAIYQALLFLESKSYRAAKKHLDFVMQVKNDVADSKEDQHFDAVIKKAEELNALVKPKVGFSSFFKNTFFSRSCKYQVVPINTSDEAKEEKLSEHDQIKIKKTLQYIYYGYNYSILKDASQAQAISKMVFIDFDDTIRDSKSGHVIAKSRWMNILKQASPDVIFYVCTSRSQCKESIDMIISILNEIGMDRFYGIIFTDLAGKVLPMDYLFYSLKKKFAHLKQEDAILLDDNSLFLKPCKEAGYSVIPFIGEVSLNTLQDHLQITNPHVGLIHEIDLYNASATSTPLMTKR